MSLNSTKDTTKLSTKEIAALGVICALMFVGKESMKFLLNIHPLVPLIFIAVIMYGWKAMYPTMGFVILEIAIYGLGLWTIMYLYAWPLLVVLAMLIRKSRKWIDWAILGGIFGLCFGGLCAIPYLFLGGWKTMASFWIAGIPFDLIHGISNFILTLMVLPLLNKVAIKLQ